MNTLSHALDLARRVPVFPCGTSKRPACPRGFHAAVRDQEAVKDLWRRYPGTLIGVPTGPASGIDVLDNDPRNGGDVWMEQNRDALPPTRIHQTRSGGQHLLFRHAPGVRNSESKIAPGIDVRGEGGYIIWWPGFGGNVLCAAPLAEWPRWLLKDLLPKPAPATAPALRVVVGGDTQARRFMQRCLDRVSNASPGGRHYALRAASYTIGGLIGPQIQKSEAATALLRAVQAAGGDKVNEDNAKATIGSGLDKGAGFPLRGFC